jgi:putative mRNA 3-end processing factor
VWKSCELLGVPLDTCERIDGDLLGVSAAKSDTREARFIIAPPSALGSGWLRRFGVEVGPHHELAKDVESAATVAEVKGRGYYTTANVSGWMNIRGIRKRSGVGCGFVISDHADFYGLKQVVRATGASQVYLNHGYTAQFGRYLAETFPTLKVSDVESLTG